ncbi:MAG: GAF domain-containing protein [Proteobacteria bacterium]|nr:GAF domain-containing protein [Pseudomonadota bacterium]
MISSKPLPTTRYGVWSFSIAALILIAVGAVAFHLAATSSSFLKALPWLVPMGVTGLIFIAYGLWILFGPKHALGDDGALHLRQQTRLLILAFGAFAGTAVTVGGLYFGEVADTLRAQRFVQQTEIAGLKAQLVEKWLLERSVEVQQLGTAIDRLQQPGAAVESGGEPVLQFLFAEMLAKSADRRSVALVDADGKVLFHVGDEPVQEDEIKAAMAPAANPMSMRIVATVRQEASGAVAGVSFIQPVVLSGSRGPAKAFLTVRMNPAPTLFRELDQWPAGGTRSQVMLVRRDGDNALLILPSREIGTDLKSSLVPLKEDKRPAVQAVLRGEGVHDGIDAMGHPVFSAVHAIANTPWFLVVASEEAELDRPVRRSVASIGLYIAATVAVSGLMLFVLWSTQRSDYLAMRAHNVEARSALVQHFQHMVLQAYDIVLLMTPDGHILEANAAAADAYGYTSDEFRALTVRDLRTPQAFARVGEQWKLAETADGGRYETEHRRKNGTVFPVEVSANVVDVDGQRFRQEFVRDISKRRTLEAEVKRLSRVLRALQEANSLLLRARTEDELYHGMCRAIVEVGGYRMANVALANDDAQKSVTFAAVAGVDDGYLANSGIGWGEGPRAEGPLGTAIRTGQVQINQNMAANPKMAPWRDEALKRNFQASISLPLKLDGQTFGALTIYSEMPNAFDDEEVAFLTQFAGDISYGVAALRARKAAGGQPPAA